jgi:predicted RNase H-like HicB family nuclease
MPRLPMLANPVGHPNVGTKGLSMLMAYIKAAMHKAHYEILPNGKGYYGKIDDLQGVCANGYTLEACRERLRRALEEWIVLGLRMGHHLPEIDGISLGIPKQSSGSEQAEWTSLAMQALENAYGENEPDYSLDAIIEKNPEYEGR